MPSPQNSPHIPSSSGTGAPSLGAARVSPRTTKVVVEETTVVKIPKMRPKPALLSVIHLGGGSGETFTLSEIIGHVQEYIRERRLYDELDPRVVNCGGDLLSEALGVDTFTVNEVIALFRQNCRVEPESCIRVHRCLVARGASSQQQSLVSSEVLGNSPTAVTLSVTSDSRTVSSSETMTANRCSLSSQREIRNSPQITTNSTTIFSDGRLHTQETSSSFQSSQSSFQTLSSSSQQSLLAPLKSSLTYSSQSSSSAFIQCQAAKTFVSVAGSDPSQPVLEQTNGSCDSCSDEGTRNHFHKGKDRQSVPQRRRSTSINVTYDEPDGMCEVMLETSPGGSPKAEDDTVIVEFDSDEFSVEYDVESDSNLEGQPSQQPAPTSLDSDENSLSPAAAILVVCKESDVEYLADYSDSDDGSDKELSDADKWQCKHCTEKNPPFQRNCGGCWSVRPDWLPATSTLADESPKNKNKIGSMTGASQDLLDITVAVTSGSKEKIDLLQSVLSSDVSLPSSQSQNSYSQCLSKSPVKAENETRTGQRKRKKSSSLSSSDSVDGNSGRLLISSQDSQVSDKLKLGRDDFCVVCLNRKKTSVIIHGKTGHQVCCYRCARQLRKQRKACPICRRPIQKLIMESMVSGWRGKGRPKKRFLEDITDTRKM